MENSPAHPSQLPDADSSTQNFRAVLVQFDLQSHSQWVMESPTRLAVQAKDQLALEIAKIMEAAGLTELVWAGDGGLYYARANETRILARSIRAATVAVNAFYEWRERSADRRDLEIRTSVHVTRHDLYLTKAMLNGHERKYATSVDLNLFMKHERELGLAGCIAVTEEARDYLSPEDNDWPSLLAHDGYSRNVLPPGSRPAFSNARYLVVKPRVDLGPTQEFFASLKDIAGADSHSLQYSGDIGPRANIVAKIDQALALRDFPLLAETKYVLRQTPSRYPDWPDNLRSELKQEAAAIVARLFASDKTDPVRANPFRVRMPLAGAPFAEIEHFDGPYSDARAANLIFERRDRETAAETLGTAISEGARLANRPYPSVLAIAAVVTTADGYLILGRRAKGGAARDGNSWSCTFERGMAAGETVEQCARRGLSEELLGNYTLSDSARYRFCGVFLEDDVLNLSILTFIELPFSLVDAVKQWQQIGANAKLDFVAGLNMRDHPERFLRECFKHKSASPLRAYADDKLGRITVYSRSKRPEPFESDNELKWEGTSLLRLAAAVWLHSRQAGP